MIPSPFKNKNIAFDYISTEDIDFSDKNIAHLLPFSGDIQSSRSREFILGRICAGRALKKLGFDEKFIIQKGINGEPVWPEGITGSISHSKNHAVSAVCFKNNYAGVGIDLEVTSRKKNFKVFKRILTEAEMEDINKINDKDLAYLKALQIFSLKEACFKAFFTAHAIKLRFKDATFSAIDNENYICEINSKINIREDHRSFEAVSKMTDDFIISGVCLD